MLHELLRRVCSFEDGEVSIQSVYGGECRCYTAMLVSRFLMPTFLRDPVSSNLATLLSAHVILFGSVYEGVDALHT